MPPPSPKNRALITLVQSVSLLATAWMVWWAALVPRLHRQTLGGLLLQVLVNTLLAWVWSALVALGLYAIMPLEDRSHMVPDVLRTAATAVWFGPAMILLSNFSLASLLPALVLVVYASRLLYLQWRPAIAALGSVGGGPPRTYLAREPGAFADCQLPQVFVWREFLPALAAALCLEAGVLAVAAYYPLLGAAWLCAGTAVLTVFSMTTGAADAGRPPTLPKSFVGILATIVLASLLSLGRGGPGGGMVGVRGGSGAEHPSLVETARAVLRQLFYGETPGEGTAKGLTVPKPKDTANTGASGGFAGVILWPEIKPVTMLIAPMPALGSNPFQGRPAQPLSIPFGGEYWMFRWPFSRPPASSILERGTPATLAFSTTDHTPLYMEAHQKLETPIDIRCCSKIQIEVLNADRYPGTLTVELFLLDTEHPLAAPLSLGNAPVISRPDVARDPVIPLRETLEFAVPQHSTMDKSSMDKSTMSQSTMDKSSMSRSTMSQSAMDKSSMSQSTMDQFTELRIVFHRSRLRMDKSAKVSVERFVLLPR